MEYQHLLITEDGLIVIVTLNREQALNALNGETIKELKQFFGQDLPARTGVRGVILTGAGSVFSAGADLGEARTGLATSSLWEELSGAIAALPGMTVAALNGTLAGGAFGMALACDIRIAAPEAKFFYPVMKLGFLPQPSDPGRLSALIGAARGFGGAGSAGAGSGVNTGLPGCSGVAVSVTFRHTARSSALGRLGTRLRDIPISPRARVPALFGSAAARPYARHRAPDRHAVRPRIPCHKRYRRAAGLLWPIPCPARSSND